MRRGEAFSLRRLLAAAALAACLAAAAEERAEAAESNEFKVVGGEEEEEEDPGTLGGVEAGHEDEEGHEGEEGEDHASAAAFTVSLGVIVVVASLLIKDLQSHRDVFEADHPITFQMVEATVEECVACGAIAMCFIILRENAFIDILAVIARLPHVRVEEEVVTEAVERIDAVIFWTLFYYFALILVCVVWVHFRQRTWEDEEEEAGTAQSKDTNFQRLRHAFFNPQVPGAGIKVANECTAFDVANVNFARYLERATAQCICEVIHLPKLVILLPVIVFVLLVAVEHFTGLARGEDVGEFDLCVATFFSWGCLISAVVLRCDVRRIYEQVLPREKEGRAPFYETARSELAREHRASMNRMKSERSERGPSVAMAERKSDRSERTLSMGGDRQERDLTPRHGASPLRASLSRRLSMLSFLPAEETPVQLPVKSPVLFVQDMHTGLFWLGTWGYGLGPKLLRTWIQGCLFGMCVCAAVTQRSFPQAFLRQHIVLFGLYCLPFPATLLCVLSCLPEYVVATKLEVLVDETLIDEVIAETKTSRFVPFVGTHTGKRLVQQMKYEAVMEFYRHLTPEEVKDIVHSPLQQDAFEDFPEMEKAMLEVIFARHDRDFSGAIDRTELQACLEEEGFSKKTAERVASDWMAIYDTDHSGYLSYEEFQMLHTVLLQEIKNAEVKPADCMAMCRRLDKNQNGKLSAEELSQAFQEWLGTQLPVKDVSGIFGHLCPMPEGEEGEGDDHNEVEIRRIAEWIFRVFEMTKAIEKSQDAMMGKMRPTFAAMDRTTTVEAGQVRPTIASFF